MQKVKEIVTVSPKGEEFEIIVRNNESGNTNSMLLSKNAHEQLRTHFVNSTFLADEFQDWIEKNDWDFMPKIIDGTIKNRWVNDNASCDYTTKELYELFLTY